ncbi:MAG: 50S ribosomal protein L6 [Deltaproteobacteria bacterium]|jgi:large subunit ribosomal protein L6|nr:MAG: 50S ribosomal protein L6 [Deltaproteobacteria bacterium]
MSRIGKLPIPVPKGVEIVFEDATLKVKGTKGELTQGIDMRIGLTFDSERIVVNRKDDDKKTRALQGLTRSLVANMVEGVTNGFTKTLNIVGVGYRAELKEDILGLNLGYSHPIEFVLPKGISAKVDKQVKVTIEGIDKQLVGEVAAKIRSFRRPEPYKGKGILCSDERIRRKIGKSGIK